MRLARSCHNALKTLCPLWLLMTGCFTTPAQAVTLNFSATLTTGTCTFSVDKSTVSMGVSSLSRMPASTLIKVQSFTLFVSGCVGSDPVLTPVIHVTGDGFNQAGKWLFRSADSTSTGLGIMLVKGSGVPGYDSPEVKHDDTIDLAPKGTVPADQNHTFYAGLTCGTATTCSSATPGTINARVLFALDYQ